MSWYDYVPLVGSFKRGYDVAAGNKSWDKAFREQASYPSIAGNLEDKLASSQEEGVRSQDKGYQDAIANLQNLSNTAVQRQMEGLDRAENYFLPAEERLNSLYGPPGSFRK